MCILETQDLSCYTQGCPNIIAFQGHEIQRKCPFVSDEEEFGSCGGWNQAKLPGSQRSEVRKFCGHCTLKKSERNQNFYDNVGEHITKSLEGQWKRNEDRRREKEEEKSVLISGAGMGWSDGQSGDLREPSGAYFDAGMNLSAIPQELELDDLGEGPSHDHDQRYIQRGDGGHNQRGGHGSSG